MGQPAQLNLSPAQLVDLRDDGRSPTENHRLFSWIGEQNQVKKDEVFSMDFSGFEGVSMATSTPHLLDSGWLSLVIADSSRDTLPSAISAKLKVRCQKMDRHPSLSSQEESCVSSSRKNRPKNPK
ncbi:hypothetical protein HNY73_000109 [Argiope bruennichi]|uniref:Uncharacterized protein n=1 Tax=Argiope bruennichi TaxID=94029 RepID=A0A8T0FWZ9_ARGBR|nr:hypothetical protein HNY73_000109 [Argiope bruennichi]